jgi:probable rRNA maturation factor
MSIRTNVWGPRVRIGIYCEPRFSGLVPRNHLRSLARETLKLGGAQIPCTLTLAFLGDEQLRDLNQEFRSVSRTTDVLSFPSRTLDPESRIPHLGDVVISVPRAESQAKHGHHGLSQELDLLVVHGVLHLLGFDHDTRPRKARMWRIQIEILRKARVQQGPSKAAK